MNGIRLGFFGCRNDLINYQVALVFLIIVKDQLKIIGNDSIKQPFDSSVNHMGRQGENSDSSGTRIEGRNVLHQDILLKKPALRREKLPAPVVQILENSKELTFKRLKLS